MEVPTENKQVPSKGTTPNHHANHSISNQPAPNPSSKNNTSNAAPVPNLGSAPGTAGNTSAWILDLNVNVVTIQGREFSGRVYSYDTISNILILINEYNESNKETKNPTREQKYNFKIIKINAIKSISPIDPTDLLINETKAQSTPLDLYLQASGHQPQFVNVGSLAYRKQKAITDAIEVSKRTNKNAPEHGQHIFNALYKQYPCRWDQNDIIVMDEVKIKAPYTPNSCEPIEPEFEATSDRLKRILEAERKKLMIENKSSVKSPSPTQKKELKSRSPTTNKRNSPTLTKKDNSNEMATAGSKKENKKKA